MAFAAVTGAAKFLSGASSSIVADSFNLAADRLVIVGTRTDNAQQVTGVTDTAGSAYVRLGVTNPGIGGGQWTEVWASFRSLAHGTNVITAALSASASARVISYGVFSYDDANAEVFIDVPVIANQISNVTITSLAFTTRIADELIVVFTCKDSTGATWTPSTNFTSLAEDTDKVSFLQYRIVSAVQTGVTVSATSGADAAGKKMFGVTMAEGVAGGGGGGGGVSRSRFQRRM